MTDKFTESMEVAEVGDLRPSSIFDGCLGCRYSRDPIRGVLIEGITPEAARMLYKQCEVVPAGTTAEIKWLKSINSDLLEAMKMVVAKLQENHVYKRLGAGFEADDDHRYLADICYELNRVINKAGGESANGQ